MGDVVRVSLSGGGGRARKAGSGCGVSGHCTQGHGQSGCRLCLCQEGCSLPSSPMGPRLPPCPLRGTRKVKTWVPPHGSPGVSCWPAPRPPGRDAEPQGLCPNLAPTLTWGECLSRCESSEMRLVCLYSSYFGAYLYISCWEVLQTIPPSLHVHQAAFLKSETSRILTPQLAPACACSCPPGHMGDPGLWGPHR